MNLLEEILEKQKQVSFLDGLEVPTHKPEMLLIGCVDARKDPIADLGIPRGKALILRNIAALIRGTSVVAEKRETEAAALEFAVKVMKVKYIVVMGHTDCGGIAAKLRDVELPAIKRYLSPLDDLKDEIVNSGLSGEEMHRAMEEGAVKMSVQNLLSYDYVREAKEAGELTIVGWLLDITSSKLVEIV